MAETKGSIMSAMVWMFIISLLLLWLPVAGPLIAGFVGGKKAGGVGAAILAVFLPGIILGLALFMFGTLLTGLPLIGAIAGGSAIALSLLHVGPMLLGAIAGGIFA